MRRWMTVALSVVLALPPTLVLLAFAASGATALTTGQPLFWPAQPVTLTEAIGMHDTAEIVRQIALGANPNIRYDTWDILKRYQHVSVTPLEAAVATREQNLFEMIVAHGALLTPENARTLHCFAVQSTLPTSRRMSPHASRHPLHATEYSCHGETFACILPATRSR
jgi:hypothetical protein